jgi:hypothetical protein
MRQGWKCLFVTACACILTLFSAMSGPAVQYFYDDLNRLWKVVYDDGTFDLYTYDEVGNRITNPSGSLTVTISPSGAVTAGAQWRVDSGAW